MQLKLKMQLVRIIELVHSVMDEEYLSPSHSWNSFYWNIPYASNARSSRGRAEYPRIGSSWMTEKFPGYCFSETLLFFPYVNAYSGRWSQWSRILESVQILLAITSKLFLQSALAFDCIKAEHVHWSSILLCSFIRDTYTLVISSWLQFFHLYFVHLIDLYFCINSSLIISDLIFKIEFLHKRSCTCT